MKVVVVVLSGGQDSTTCLHWALKHYKESCGDDVVIKAVTYQYGQKHRREVACAKTIAERAGVFHYVDTLLPLIGRSPLVNENTELGKYDDPSQLPGGVEPTFVPCRNIVFLTYAANYAMSVTDQYKGAPDIDIVTGVCQADYGGYFDCRDLFIAAFERALNQGIFGHDCFDGLTEGDGVIKIVTPLMDKTKKQTVEFAIELGCIEELVYTHTCYDGGLIPCGKCHACIIRERGFYEAGIPDPLVLQQRGVWPPEMFMRKVE